MLAAEFLLNMIIGIQYVCTCYSMSFNTAFVSCIAPLNLSREFVYLCIHFIAPPPACEGRIRDGCDRCKLSFSSAMKTGCNKISNSTRGHVYCYRLKQTDTNNHTGMKKHACGVCMWGRWMKKETRTSTLDTKQIQTSLDMATLGHVNVKEADRNQKAKKIN